MNPPSPPWISALTEEDLHFIRRFVLASGSLKALASEYKVSYPTLRSRLDRLIEKISALEQHSEDNVFQRTVRLLVADGKLGAESARTLLQAHKATLDTTEDGK